MHRQILSNTRVPTQAPTDCLTESLLYDRDRDYMRNFFPGSENRCPLDSFGVGEKNRRSNKMVNKESYLHKMAKELLYNQIVENGEFRGKDASGKQYHNQLRYSDRCVMEHPVDYMGYTEKHQDYRGNTGIIHDIAITNGFSTTLAIEIVNKHYPKWEDKTHLPYMVYVIKAENILKRVANTPAFIERVIF